MKAWPLLRAVRIVTRKDSGAFRQLVFDTITRTKWSIRCARWIHRWLGKSWLSSLLVAGYGLKSYLAVDIPGGSAPYLAVGKYRNEGRQFDHLERCIGSAHIRRVSLGLSALFTRGTLRAFLQAGLHGRDVRAYLRLVHRTNGKHSFLVSCRVASTLGYYARFTRELPQSGAQVVLTSSDSNPYAMGLAYAARSQNLPTVYIPHGHIPEGPPTLDFDLNLLDGPALRTVYEEMGPIQGAVVFKGAEGQYRPMNTTGLQDAGNLTLGIFMSLIVDWPRFARLLRGLQEHVQPKRILLRLHPNKVVRDPATQEALRGIPSLEVSEGTEILLKDAEQCDLVVAGNTSCHLTLLKYGVPTVYLHGMDAVPHDFYRFIQHRIIPAIQEPDALSISAVRDFYEAPDWRERFRFFDPSYAADQAALDRDVGRAIHDLL